MSTITMEQRKEIIKEAEALIRQGKKEEGYALIRRKTPMDPMMANDYKIWFKMSPREMLARGYNLDDAVEVYGERWLDE